MFCILAAAQVVVLLLLGGIFLHMRGQENRLQARSLALAAQIDAIDRTPFEVNNNALNEATQLETLWAQVESTLPPEFDPAWLQAVLDTVPQRNSILTFEFAGDAIVLTALAENFDAITEHQQALDAFGLFIDIHLGATQRLDSGHTRYTMRLTPLAADNE